MLYDLWCAWRFVQAMHAHSSVAVGMKGASKAMAAMNKVPCSILYFKYFLSTHNVFVPVF